MNSCIWRFIILCSNTSWFSKTNYWWLPFDFGISFHEITMSIYIIEINGNDSLISVEVPENKTVDIAGNKNLRSNILQLKHCKAFCLPYQKKFSYHLMIVPVLTSIYYRSLTSSAFSLKCQNQYALCRPGRWSEIKRGPNKMHDFLLWKEISLIQNWCQWVMRILK